MQWYIGCSGFHYKEWKEVFYPKGLPPRAWFQFYATHFNALELNNTFYRFPELAFLENWYAKAPEGFCFAVKAPRAITHDKKFVATEFVIQSFYEVLKKGLQEKLGPVLFQLPPSFAFSPERLQALVAQFDPAFKNTVEFRNISWWRDDVIETLRAAGITFCSVSFPGLIDNVVVNTPYPYYRFHGVPRLYQSAYDDGLLKNIVDAMAAVPDVKTACLFFNNTMSGAALQNAKTVQRLTAPLS